LGGRRDAVVLLLLKCIDIEGVAEDRLVEDRLVEDRLVEDRLVEDRLVGICAPAVHAAHGHGDGDGGDARWEEVPLKLWVDLSRE